MVGRFELRHSALPTASTGPAVGGLTADATHERAVTAASGADNSRTIPHRCAGAHPDSGSRRSSRPRAPLSLGADGSAWHGLLPVSYTHLRAHETRHDL